VPPTRPVVRRALLRHAALTGVVALLLSALTVAGIWVFARQEAYRTAGGVATRVAAAVIVTLSRHDYDRPPESALAGLSPFLESGMVSRVKVWRVDGEQVQVVLSDEPRVVGDRRRFDAGLARRLDAGEVVVLPVPDDPEHRFERTAGGSMLEAFVGFRDAAGHPMRLEVYVGIDRPATVRAAMLALLPLMLGSLLLLAIATVPLTVLLARRVERDQRERQAVLHYGLAASERERRELAQKLHDGVIQDLAGTGLLLDALRRDEPAGTERRALLDRAHAVVEDDVVELRSLLTELFPAGIGNHDVQAALHELADEFRDDDPEIRISVSPAVRPGERRVILLHRIARELVRNAVRHAAPSRVEVVVEPTTSGGSLLTVIDDGCGFDPAAPPREGHIGLRLVEQVVEENGGRFRVTSAPGRGTTAAVDLPAGIDAGHDVTGAGRAAPEN
jgi:two-component system, NarL family, sensor kinase